MGDKLSEIRDDIAEYRRLCAHFGVGIQYIDGSPDCYSELARGLKALAKEPAKLTASERDFAAGDFNAEALE